MADSKLTRMVENNYCYQRKHTAAMVLQHTWFIHKYSELGTTKDEMKLRFHQRRFLAAINELVERVVCKK
uniref:Calmodulin-binding domain-containing protein n=1 Tax=Romanomermis culicivorax TaxID=13658 RepID=A0A915HZU9_ROMCU